MFAGIWLKLLAGLAAIGGVMATLLMARKSGADANEVKHQKATAEAVSSRARTDDEVAKMARAEREAEYAKWARK
jgi:hypothetical protein